MPIIGKVTPEDMHRLDPAQQNMVCKTLIERAKTCHHQRTVSTEVCAAEFSAAEKAVTMIRTISQMGGEGLARAVSLSAYSVDVAFVGSPLESSSAELWCGLVREHAETSPKEAIAFAKAAERSDNVLSALPALARNLRKEIVTRHAVADAHEVKPKMPAMRFTPLSGLDR